MAPLKQQQHGRLSMSAKDFQSSNLTSARFFGGVQKGWMTNPNQPVSRPDRRCSDTRPREEQGPRASNQKPNEKPQSLSLDLAAAKSTEAYPSPGKLLSPEAEVNNFPVERHSSTSTVDKQGEPAFSVPLSSKPDTARLSPRARSATGDRRQPSSQLISSLPSPSPSLEHQDPLEAQGSLDEGNLVVQESCNDTTNVQSHSSRQLEGSDAPQDQTGVPRPNPPSLAQEGTPNSPILTNVNADLEKRQSQAQTGGAFRGPLVSSTMSNTESTSTLKRRQSSDMEAQKRRFRMLQSTSSNVDGNRPLGSPSNVDPSQRIPFNSALAKQVCDRIEAVFQSHGRGEIEIKRLHLLEEACLKSDIEYIMMHQLFCWTHINGSLVNCAYLAGTMPIHDRGLAILQHLLASNDSIPRDGIEWFSKFPKPLTNDANKTLELVGFEQELLNCLESMANRWSDLEVAYTTRRLPPSFGDISSVLGVRSAILQTTVLRMILRTLWVGSHDKCLQQCEEIFSRARSSFLFGNDPINAQALKTHYDHILARHAQHSVQNSSSHETIIIPDGSSDSRQIQPPPAQRNPQPLENFHPIPHRYVLPSQSPVQSPNITVAPNAQSLPSHGTPFSTHLPHYAANPTIPRSSTNTDILHSQLSSGLSRATGNMNAHQSNSYPNNQAQNQQNSGVQSPNYSDRGQFMALSGQPSFLQAQENVAQRFSGMERVVGNRAPVGPTSLGDRQRQLFSPQHLPQSPGPQTSAMIAPLSPSTNLSPINSLPGGAGFWLVPQSFNQGLLNNVNPLQTNTTGSGGQGWTGSMNNIGSPPSVPPSRPPSLPPSLPPSIPPSIPFSMPPPIPPSIPPSLPASLPQSLPHSMSPSMPPPLLPTIPPGIRSNTKSPQLVAADCPDHLWKSRHFRFVTHLFRASVFLTRNSPFQSWSATIERQHMERRANEVPGPLGLPLRPVKNFSTVFRIKCTKNTGARGLPSEAQWTVMETKWPENIAVSLNGINIEIRKKPRHGKDSPVDVTALVREGHNEIKAGVLGLPEKSDEQYLVGLEIVHVIDHAHLKSFINLLEIESAKQRILQRFHDADPDIKVIERVLDLTDPFTSRIFNIPSRGKDCLHDQCFDLDTFFDTRNAKDSSQPCAPEVFRCPICKGDARPSSLVIDGFFLAIRLELARHRRLDVKAIRIKRDGDWEIKEEEEAVGETGDGGTARSSSASGPSGRRMSSGSHLRESTRGGVPAPLVSGRTNTEAEPIIILDD